MTIATTKSNQTLLGIRLSEGIRKSHMRAYLAVAFISSSYAGALAVLQPGLLQVMGIEKDQQAMLTGGLSALQEVVLILLMGVMGALSDRIGRRPVYVAGLLLTGIGFALYPHAVDVTQLVLFRLIVAVGCAAMIGMMITVVADYARDESRGKANGLQGLLATLGAFIPPILATLPTVFTQQDYSELNAQQLTFAIAGALGGLGGMIAWFGLSPAPASPAQSKPLPLAQQLKKGLHAARDGRTALSYGAAFISRGDLAVTGAFMSLWLVQYGVGQLGLTPSEAMFQLAVPRTLAVVTGALLGSLLMGQLADKMDRVNAVALSAGMAACVYLSVFLISDPTADWVMGLLFCMGIAEISAFVSSQALVGQQAPAADRGAIIGVFGVSGAIGILLGTAGGGWLFGYFQPSAPFVLFGFLNALVCVWALLLRQRETASTAQPQDGVA